MPENVPQLLANLSLDHVLRTIPSGLFLVDLEQRIVHWNAEAERITGFSAAEAVGRHCSFLAGIPCGRGCGLYEAALPKPIHGAYCRIRTRAGREITLLKNVDYLRDADGKVIGGIESFIDVTRQVRLEKALRRQTARLERSVRRRTGELEAERAQLDALLDAMADFAYICAEDRKIVYMNRAMIAVFGDRVGETCFEVFYGRSLPCEECPMAQVLAGIVTRHERFLPPTGRLYEIIHSPLRIGDSTQKLAVYRDITERKVAEEKLREANNDLDAFVAMAAHDLRAPLSPILSYVDLLRETCGDRLTAQELDMLQEIEKQGEKMLALLEDLLLLARVGHLPPPPEPVDADAVLRGVLEELRVPLNEARLRVEAGPLPRLALPATLLSQVLANLLGNAVLYAASPGAAIEVGSSQLGERVRLFVRDHGPGIPPADRQHIFDPFFRGAAARASRGTGIGLSIVRKIVRLYEGRVWVEETPGGGATFWVELPKGG